MKRPQKKKKMNTTLKTLTLLAFLSLGSISLSAAGAPKHDNNSVTVREKIQRAVSLPEELKTPGFTQNVKVSFILDEKGKVTEVAAQTTNPALKQKLENQFKQIAFTELKAGTYHIALDFIVY